MAVKLGPFSSPTPLNRVKSLSWHICLGLNNLTAFYNIHVQYDTINNILDYAIPMYYDNMIHVHDISFDKLIYNFT